MTKLSAEELRNKWSLLPPELQQQVLDFVEFLLEKHQLFRRSPSGHSSGHSDYDDNESLEGSNEGSVAVARVRKSRVLGLSRGDVWMSDDFNEPLPDDFWLGKL